MTRVKFVIHPQDETKTVFAVFPQIKFKDARRISKFDTILSYEHVGQHSECSVEYASECYAATPDQYKDLQRELELSVGYELIVMNEIK